MEAAWSSKTSVFYHNTEDLDLYIYRRENLRSRIMMVKLTLPYCIHFFGICNIRIQDRDFHVLFL